MNARRIARGARGFAIGVAALAVACAKEEPPPGTGPDREPPRVVTLRPGFGESVPGFDGKASVRFSEPLADPRNLTRQVVGSPAGRYRVDPGRRGLQVRPEGNWVEGAVYFITLPSGINDLLRNPTTKPVEWLFRVGGEVPDTEVSGRLIDRVSGRGERDGRLLFLSADSVPYTAVSDTGGIYRLPGLPAGTYEAVGFTDQNRNFLYDPQFEPGSVVPFTIEEGGKVTGLDVVMLPADSTPPVVARAEALDSLTVLISFDDPLDPEASLDEASVAVRDSASGEAVSVDSFSVGRPEGAGPEDLLEGDFEGGEGFDPDAAPEEDFPEDVPEEGNFPEDGGFPEDEAFPEGDFPEGGEGLEPGFDAEPGFAGERGPGGRGSVVIPPAPASVTVHLARPLAEGAYEVEAAGFANLRGLRGGGGARFTYVTPAPVVPDSAAAVAPDSAIEVPPDSAAAPDSAAVPDSAAAPEEGP